MKAQAPQACVSTDSTTVANCAGKNPSKQNELNNRLDFLLKEIEKELDSSFDGVKSMGFQV